MALPATYNINYYHGDTFKMYILPKDKSGNPVPLAGYTAKFVVSEKRGFESKDTAVVMTASVDEPNSRIYIEIPSATGKLLNPDKTYVYDVALTHSVSGDVETYLTGSVSITGDVTDQ